MEFIVNCQDEIRKTSGPPDTKRMSSQKEIFTKHPFLFFYILWNFLEFFEIFRDFFRIFLFLNMQKYRVFESNGRIRSGQQIYGFESNQGLALLTGSTNPCVDLGSGLRVDAWTLSTPKRRRLSMAIKHLF